MGDFEKIAKYVLIFSLFITGIRNSHSHGNTNTQVGEKGYVFDYKLPVDSQDYLNKLQENQYKCLNNLNMTSSQVLRMSIEEKLEAFKNSECAPVVILPGFMGTKMEFKMKNCEEFQKFHPNIMKSCGWTSCERSELKRFTIWINAALDMMEIVDFVLNDEDGVTKKRINKELYIPHFVRRLTVDDKVIEYSHRDECFGNLFRVYYQKEGQEIKMTNLKGAEIKIKQSNVNNCGFDTVSNYLGNMLSVTRNFQGFAKVDEYLLNMGYTRGVSLFYHPYDFRLPIKTLLKRIDYTVKTAYKITKKKPILIGHSFGGLLAYKYSLDNPELVKEVVTIGSPFLGSFFGAEQLLMKSNLIDIEKSIHLFGYNVKIKAKIDERSSKLIFNSFPSLHFLPKDIIHDEIDAELMKISKMEKNFSKTEFKQMILENNFLSYFYSIFPKIHSDCRSIASKNFELKHLSPVCKTNYRDLISETLLHINEKEIALGKNLNNTFREHYTKAWKEEIYNHHKHLHEGFKIEADEFFDHLLTHQDHDLFKFDKPTVPFTFIYSNHLDTPAKKVFVKGKLVSTEYSSGDEVVNGFSQVYPGLRWLYKEYEGKSQEESKHPSIHFVEYCAQHKRKSVGTYNKNSTQYISLSCDCIDQTNLDPRETCNHAAMVGDTKLVMFIGEVIAKSQSKTEKVNNFEDLFKEKFKKKMMCSHLDLS